MKWWAFVLILDDGMELPWQAAGKTPTQALQEVVTCWLQRLGDSALFLGHDLIAVECLGPLGAEELNVPEMAHAAPTVPSSSSSWDSGSDSLEIEVSQIGDTSRIRRVRLDGK